MCKTVHLAAARGEAKRLYIERGFPWGNGCRERVNSNFRNELLNLAIYYLIQEIKAPAK